MPTRVEHRPLPGRAFPPIEGYGLVGDGHSAALVSSYGAVEWWCPERFDAPSVFARILDRDRGGHFSVGLPEAHRREVSYVGATNVHRVEHVAGLGSVAVTTFMPYAEAGHPRPDTRRIVRIVECLEGEVDVTVEVAPAFDYGRVAPEVAREGGRLVFRGGGRSLRLASTLPLDEDARGTFRVRAGERAALVLAAGADGGADALAEADDALRRELAWWGRWIARCSYDGPYAAHVRRSMLALKLLQHVPTGAFVAAPTMGLPEIPGLDENWDYRYAWLRDGSFIVMAFETTGYAEEALRFRRWLADIVKRDAPDRLQTLYRVDGGRDVPEETLDHLGGYGGARPVYLGNKAVEQHQLDTYGEVMMCFHRADAIFDEQRDEVWPALRALVDRVRDEWREPDSGIWELRTEHRQRVYSKAMAWLAVKHGLEIAAKQGVEAPTEAWERVLDEIRAYVEERGYDPALAGFKETTDRAVPDAANLLLPVFGFCDHRDPRLLDTLDSTARVLASHGLLHRHLQAQSRGVEGAFLACSFWLAYDLALAGRPEEARRWFEAALDVAGPLGLLPEEADAVTRAALGNYPQALSHLSLVLAGWAIGHAEGDGRRARVAREASRTGR